MPTLSLHPLRQWLGRLAPTRCLLCDASLGGELLCSGCQLDLPFLAARGALCESCSLPLSAPARYCGHCLHRPPAFDCSVIPFAYDYPLDRLIHHLKYHRNLTCARALSQLLVDAVNAAYASHPERRGPELIVPVPMHWSRRLKRGYNQAEVLAGALGQALALPVTTRLCRRTRRTAAQQGLNRRARQRNLRGAFAIERSAARSLEDRCVALVDDVVTTTATTRALARQLMGAGAAEVHIWALARVPD